MLHLRDAAEHKKRNSLDRKPIADCDNRVTEFVKKNRSKQQDRRQKAEKPSFPKHKKSRKILGIIAGCECPGNEDQNDDPAEIQLDRDPPQSKQADVLAKHHLSPVMRGSD
jgi:hypothetical protein